MYCKHIKISKNGLKPYLNRIYREWNKEDFSLKFWWMRFICTVGKVVDVCSVRGSCIPYILVLCPKWSLYTSFYARLQCWPLPISLGPHLCWSGLCARLWMSLWISFSLCDDLPFLLLLQSLWTKLIFFVQKWQPYTIPWPSGHVICFRHFFSREDVVSPKSYVTFVFCCMLKMSSQE